jgi:hypothetical protein
MNNHGGKNFLFINSNEKGQECFNRKVLINCSGYLLFNIVEITIKS